MHQHAGRPREERAFCGCVCLLSRYGDMSNSRSGKSTSVSSLSREYLQHGQEAGPPEPGRAVQATRGHKGRHRCPSAHREYENRFRWTTSTSGLRGSDGCASSRHVRVLLANPTQSQLRPMPPPPATHRLHRSSFLSARTCCLHLPQYHLSSSSSCSGCRNVCKAENRRVGCVVALSPLVTATQGSFRPADASPRGSLPS